MIHQLDTIKLYNENIEVFSPFKINEIFLNLDCSCSYSSSIPIFIIEFHGILNDKLYRIELCEKCKKRKYIEDITDSDSSINFLNECLHNYNYINPNLESEL